MAHRLHRLRLKRISLVDTPANEQARVMLWKSASGEPAEKMQPTAAEVHVDEMVECKGCKEPMKKDETKCSKCGAEVTKAADGRPEEGQVDEKLKADLDAALAEVEKLKAERDALAKRLDTPEEIEKRKLAGLPESVRKQLEDQAAEIRKMRDERSEAEQIEAVRKDMSGLPGKHEDVGRLLKRVKDVVSAEDFASIETMLKAASAQIEKGDLFREKGKPGDGPGAGDSPKAQIDRLVAGLVEKSKDIKVGDAYAQVAREHPELYAAYARTVTVGANADQD